MPDAADTVGKPFLLALMLYWSKRTPAVRMMKSR